MHESGPREIWIGAAVALGAALVTRLWLELLPSDVGQTSVDLPNFFYPAFRYVGEEYAAGRLPRWNPYLGGGTSALADIQIALFYPPTLVFALLPAEIGLFGFRDGWTK